MILISSPNDIPSSSQCAHLLKAGRFGRSPLELPQGGASHKLTSQTTDISVVSALFQKPDLLDLCVGKSGFLCGLSLLIDGHLLPVTLCGLLSFSVGVFQFPLLRRASIIWD